MKRLNSIEMAQESIINEKTYYNMYRYISEAGMNEGEYEKASLKVCMWEHDLCYSDEHGNILEMVEDCLDAYDLIMAEFEPIEIN